MLLELAFIRNSGPILRPEGLNYVTDPRRNHVTDQRRNHVTDQRRNHVTDQRRNHVTDDGRIDTESCHFVKWIMSLCQMDYVTGRKILIILL
jgi:hypothetical protein